MALLNSGEKLGPYEILEPLGAGGMGEVWKARDSRLNRFVAIKKSQSAFTERFAREAQAAAQLNHPHLCQIYDVGADYLVMEYVEGKPLSGPMPVQQALKYAVQICDALDTAHRKGIIHRDLKPGNILVGKSGVKILDFGLAKIENEAKSQDQPTASLTEAGVVLGTLQYMSPEQIEGEQADARSDIFALGLVLYEMITGKAAFSGKSRASLIASILKEEPPPLGQLEPLTPASLERVVFTCLEKHPDKRWQSAREVQHALEWIQTPTDTAPPAPATRRAWIWPAVAAMLFAILAAGAWSVLRTPATPARATRFEVTLPQDVQFSQYVSVSPDGRKLVFNATGAQGGLWIRDLETLQWRRLAGTEESSSPFWSPDSRYLGFTVRSDLKKIEVSGGPPQTLCTVQGPAGTGTWNKDDVIVFGGKGNGPIRRVTAAGGMASDTTVVDTARGEAFHGLPMFLPDGKHFVYLRIGTLNVTGMYVGSIDVKPEEQSKERILATGTAAQYAAGYLFFVREGTLMAQPLDEGKFQLTGEPVPVAEHVGTELANGYFSASPSGVLAYRTAAQQAAGFQTTWFDRQGNVTGTFGPPSLDQGLSLSPDATRATVRDAPAAPAGDAWLLDLLRGVRTRLTFRQSAGTPPVWSPDGNRIVFTAGNLMDTIFEKAVSGAGDEKELLKEANVIHIPINWSRDGRWLVYNVLGGVNGSDIWVLPMEGDRKPAPLVATRFNESDGTLSPDGRWLAYTSADSGRNEVYVRPFIASGTSGPLLGEGKWQVSKDGGDSPLWRNDEKEIVFRNMGSPVAVDVNASGAAFQSGTPHRLFEAPPNNGWDMTADGKRFIVTVSPKQQSAPTPITVVLNWTAGLKK